MTDWETLVTGAGVKPVRKDWVLVQRGAPVIRVWWEVWPWRDDMGAQALDVSVSYECPDPDETMVGSGEMMADAVAGKRRTERLLGGLVLLSQTLAPGHWKQDVTDVTYRTSGVGGGGFHGRVRTWFKEDNLELFGSLEVGLEEFKRKVRA